MSGAAAAVHKSDTTRRMMHGHVHCRHSASRRRGSPQDGRVLLVEGHQVQHLLPAVVLQGRRGEGCQLQIEGMLSGTRNRD